MPGSATTPDRPGARGIAPVRVAFHGRNCVGIRDDKSFAAQWLAYALPYQRFADILANACARLGPVDRYSFTERDLHPLLLAGFAGALREPSHPGPPEATASCCLLLSAAQRGEHREVSPRSGT